MSMKRNKVLMIIILIFYLGVSISVGQNIKPGFYNHTTQSFVLNNFFFTDKNNYEVFKKYLNSGLFNENYIHLEKIIEYNFKNYSILLQIAKDLEKNYPFIDPHDSDIFISYVYRAVKKEKFLNKLLQYYYLRFLVEDKTIIDNFVNGPEIPYPWLLHGRQEMLPIIRHLIQKYGNYINENIYLDDNIPLHEIGYFLESEYMDNSLTEINSIFKDSLIESINIPNNFLTINTSSVLGVKYSNKNLLDYSLNTAWVEGEAGNGINEWIEIELNNEYLVDNLLIFPGYGKSFKLFKANSRLKKIKLSWNNKSKIVKFEDLFATKCIPIHDLTKKIKITILDVHPGSKYSDTCVSELMLTKVINKD